MATEIVPGRRTMSLNSSLNQNAQQTGRYPAWGATSSWDCTFLRFKTFQSTLPHGERPNGLHVLFEIPAFQSTLPHGERRSVPSRASSATHDFNPRSRMGSDPGVRQGRRRVGISIHAPAWGATVPAGDYQCGHGFQSTLPHGERPNLMSLFYATGDISIHAPAWGATAAPLLTTINWGFQSTLPHGERPNRRAYCHRISLFQSTLPHGERPYQYPHDAVRQVISIHAPAWGATIRVLITPGVSSDFNPRSRMGSDSISRRSTASRTHFNPRSRMGSDSAGISRPASR